MSSQLAITFAAPSSSDAASRLRLTLQQKALPGYRHYANLNLVQSMLNHAMGGGSARKYLDQGCMATIENGKVIVPFTVYAFPSDLGLSYRLTAAAGVVNQGVYVELAKSFDLVVPMTDRVDLPGLMAGAGFTWQTLCYNEFGEVVGQPEISLHKDSIRLSDSVFGVLRVKGYLLGYEHTIIMEIVKSEADQEDEGQRVGYRIDNLENTVQAVWMDEEEQQSASIDLEIPQCVKDMLATCPGGDLLGDVSVTHADEGKVTTVYYNTCTGDPIGTYTDNEAE